MCHYHLNIVYISTTKLDNKWLCSVMVITTDFESVNPGSIPGTTYNSFHLTVC